MTQKNRPNYLLFAIRAFATAMLTISMILAFLPRQIFLRDPDQRQRVAAKWMHRWGKMAAKIFGYQITLKNLQQPKGCLIVPNHVGYGDIVVLLAAHPCVFVSKADVREWPVFGWGARLGGIIFVNRRRDRGLQSTNEQIKRRLQAGDNVVVFLESTTHDGLSVQRFHSSFLQAAIDVDAPILPVALKWSTKNPHVSLTEDIAYWKDHTMGPHIVRHLGRNSKLVKMNYGAQMPTTQACRKTLADNAYQQVVELFEQETEQV